jgi:hypothetical protein
MIFQSNCNHYHNMFIICHLTGRQMLNHKNMRRINDYNMIKKMILGCSNEDSKINLEILINLVDQVYQKQAIYE